MYYDDEYYDEPEDEDLIHDEPDYSDYYIEEPEPDKYDYYADYDDRDWQYLAERSALRQSLADEMDISPDDVEDYIDLDSL